jgi:hypothetical protein
MKLRLAAAALSMVSVSAAAMPVQTFLTKADALQSKGPLAIFSGDLKLLMNTIKVDANALKTERLSAKTAGQTPAYCPTSDVNLTNKDIVEAMRAVPPADRTRTDTRDALRSYMAKRFPCRT